MSASGVVRPHWPSIAGRARADAGSLLVVAAVVAVIALLTGAAPPLLRLAADEAVRDAVGSAEDDTVIVAHARWEYDEGPNGRTRNPGLAQELDAFRGRARGSLDPELLAVLRPAIGAATSISLNVTDGSLLRTFQLSYLAGDGGPPAVTWIAGGSPGASVPVDRAGLEMPYNAPPWPVQVGLSEAVATAMQVGPGDRLQLKDEQLQVKDVTVSGVFRPLDAADPAWRLAPWLLGPVAGGPGATITRLGGLLSAESLPDARLAFQSEEFQRTATFAPDPDAVTWALARDLAELLVALKADSGSSGDPGATLTWETRLDGVLRDVGHRIEAASAQASVLLTGVAAGTVLVLLVAAEALARRRTPTLAAARQRGAALPDLFAELLVESAAVAGLAGAIGLALARLVAPDVSWAWAAPVMVAAALTGPAFGTLAAARATRDRRAPANRAARRWLSRTSALRRAALEVAVLVAALGALVALHQRGIVSTSAFPVTAGAVMATPAAMPVTSGAVPIGAAALGVLAGALVLLRLLPPGTNLALRLALRSRRPLAVFGAARAAATSRRALAWLVLAVPAGLAAFALTLGATAERGLVDGAWQTVGADARLDVTRDPEVTTPDLVRRLSGAPGVEQVVAGQVTDGARFSTGPDILVARLVVVSSAEYARLLAATPPHRALPELASPDAGGVPALVRFHDRSHQPRLRLDLLRDRAPAIPLVAIGQAPTIGDAEDVVIVDSATIAAAGMTVVPNTVWVTGPGTGAALTARAGELLSTGAARPVLREDVLRARQAAPLSARLLRLAWVSAGTLLALALLGLALGATASAPERWQTLTRLRTLGLRARDTRWVAAGELLPPVLLAAIGGPLLGLLVGHVSLGRLALHLLTGQPDDPVLVPPWWWLGLIALAPIAGVAALVPLEAARRRRLPLGDMLRAG